jgi:hypothetical protein
MRNGSNQRGEGRIGLLIAIIVIGVAVFVGAKVIPVRIKAYEFKDHIRQEARHAAIHKDNNKMVKRIMDKALDLELPINAKDLKVKRTNSEVIVKASFEQPIDLKFYTYVYKFNTTERAPLF